MKSNKLVSVIIPVYNASVLLYRSLNSLINQDYNNVEIIIVDDGSTDDSLRICKEFLEKNKSIKLFHQENKGVSSARNLGLKHALGEYICFLDADDYAKENMISTLVDQLETFVLDIVVCSFSTVKDGKIANKIIPTHETKIYNYEKTIDNIAFKEEWAGYTWNKLFTRKSIGETKFNEKLYMREDLIFCYSVINRGIRVGFHFDCLYYYCLSANSVTKQALTNQRLSLLYADEIELKYFISNIPKQQKIDFLGKRLVKGYYVYYFSLIISKLDEKKQWMEYISCCIAKYRVLYPVFKTMTLKNKVKYLVVTIHRNAIIFHCK